LGWIFDLCYTLKCRVKQRYFRIANLLQVRFALSLKNIPREAMILNVSFSITDSVFFFFEMEFVEIEKLVNVAKLKARRSDNQ